MYKLYFYISFVFKGFIYIYFKYAYMHIHIHIFLFIYFSYIHIYIIITIINIITTIIMHVVLIYSYSNKRACSLEIPHR